MSDNREVVMDMSLLRPLDNKLHIIALIEKAALFGGEIWQSAPGEQQGRRVAQILRIYTDLSSGRLILTTPSLSQLRLDQTIFIRLNYRNIIFRLFPGQFSATADKMSCDCPDEVRALEERKGGDRYVLPNHADLSLSLKRMERTIREMTYEMELRIIDVSQRGFAIQISGPNREYLRKNDHFWLNAIDHKPLRTPIAGSVCYVAPKGQGLKQGDVRVGLSLSMAIGKDLLENLKRKCVYVLSA